MATYSTDLATFDLADSASNWAELSGHTTGAAPAATTEAYIHNGTAVDQATGQATGTQAGVQCDYGSNITWTTGWVITAWQFFAAPTNLDTWANGGMRIGVGSTSGNMKFFNAIGSDFGAYPYGGWQNTAIDPTLTADATDGSPTGAVRLFGSLPNMLNKITKGSPHVCDAVRYGRGEIKAISTGATFSGMAAANDASTARWGLFQATGGGYLWKGLMSLGDSSNSVTFSDSNKAIRIDDTPRVSSGFNKIEINHASSSVTWNGISISGVQTSITGSAPTSPGDFEVVADATIDFDSCTFTDMGTFVFNGSSNPNTVDGTVFRRCGQITLNGAAMDSCQIINSEAAIAMKCGSDVSGLSNIDFISTGTGHAIEITGGTTHTLDAITFTGYAASNGSTGNEAVYVNIGSGNVTIYADSTFSYRTAGATVTIVAGSVPTTVTVTTVNGTPISSAYVALFAKDGTGDLPYQDTVTISNSGTTATVTHTAHGMITGDKVLIEGGSLDANRGVFTITKINDNSYSYTMASTPGSSPTGTITATWTALYGTTNASGQITMSRVFSTDQPVTGWARKSTSAPYYKTGPINGTIDSADGAPGLTAILLSDQ